MAEQKKPSRSQMDKARTVAEKRFSGRAYVTGVDVGYKWEKGEPTKKLCVRVHVKEKRPRSVLEASEVFPDRIDGVPLDVIEGEYRIRLSTSPADHQQKLQFLLGGISVGHFDVTAGTIGTLVIDQTDGTPALLSNWHVLAGPTANAGDAILQPGRADGGVPGEDTVARLSRSILDRDGDAAIARLNGARQWLPLSFGAFDILTGVRNSNLGEHLVKSGRTTAQTEGRVDGEGTYFIEYQVQPNVFERRGISGFKLVHVPGGSGELSSGGDSGAVWYSANSKEAVGLHFAGEIDPDPRAEHAIACNMAAVAERLNIRIADPSDLLQIGHGAASAERATQTSNLPVSLSGTGTLPAGTGSISARRSGPEFTPSPDDPIGPGWPWGPVGPWPWDPRGPWCPDCGGHFGGEVPWPLSRRRISRDFGFPSSTGRYAGSGLESLLEASLPPGSTITFDGYIWPRLQRALIAKDPQNYSGVGQQDKLSDYRTPHTAAVAEVRRAIINSPEFQDDGIRPGIQHLQPATVFSHVVFILGRFYELRGYTVLLEDAS